MRIDVRDNLRRPIGRVTVDPAGRPTRVTTEALSRRPSGMSLGSVADNQKPRAVSILSREVFLNWDTALDDAGQLRRCVSCGCTDLFKEKAFPQVTAVIVILAFIGAIIGAVGWASTPVLYGMGVILVLDVAILILSRRRLVCYQCRTTFGDLPIARYHRGWDRAVADRYPAQPPEPQEVPAIARGEGRAITTTAESPTSSDSTMAPAEQTNYFASS